MSVQTNHYKLTKDSSYDFYNVDAINQNLDKIDKGMNDNKNQINTKSNKTHNHDGVYEPVISKKTGFNLNKSDSLTNSSTNTLATSNAIKTLNDKLKEVNKKLDENSTVEFETNGSTVTSFPSGAKGLFRPVVEGREPLFNLLRGEWKVTSSGIAEGNLIKNKTDVDGDLFCYNNSMNFKPSTEYTFVYIIYKNQENSILNNAGAKDRLFNFTSLPNDVGLHKVMLTSNNLNSSTIFFDPGARTTEFEMEILGIYEGDQINNPNVDVARPYGVIPTSQSYDLVTVRKNKFDNWNNPTRKDTNISLLNELDLKLVFTGDSGAISKVYNLKPNTTYSLSYIKKVISGTCDNNVRGTLNNSDGLTVWSSHQSVRTNSDGLLSVIFFVYNQTVDVEFSEIMIEEDKGEESGIYEPYTPSKTEFSVGEDTPLIELPNGVKNKVLENGKYEVNIKKYNTKSDDITVLEEKTNISRVKIHTALISDLKQMSENIDGASLIPGYVEMSSTGYDDVNNIGKYYINAYNDVWLICPKDAYSTLEQARIQLAGILIYYQLANSITIEDGQQGYKAPKPINIYEGGDGVVRGTHVKRY